MGVAEVIRLKIVSRLPNRLKQLEVSSQIFSISLSVKVLDFVQDGGAGGTRTPYLFNAIEALSQLSYSPTGLHMIAQVWVSNPPPTGPAVKSTPIVRTRPIHVVSA